MKFKNFILYNIKKKIKNCINCNFCTIFCPKFKIYKKKKTIIIKQCNFCKYCNIFCKINCIK
ncbi:hypothetical protein [Candidatus Carsonella ruddii]|uniref:4Fe-4S ferredoxin-type domain-containing protein n=1 Tax=Carsonella ruddii TaxID=114186 RepID=A0A1U9RRY2_CARRU|nr:hypothetical protein [Candidatus Carsonella ruddii]AQU89539.1 Hypothetical Protein BW244_0121 [Candidatus Carsonella ruddii]